jgi:hypothetical protein
MKTADKYPDKIYATEKIGSNGIRCLDYRNYDDDVEYIKLSQSSATDKAEPIQGESAEKWFDNNLALSK